jgi:chemotaxis response regulator CheB
MPSAAIQTGCADFILPLEEIPKSLLALVVRGKPLSKNNLTGEISGTA